MIGTIAKLWGAAALVAGASLFAETAAEQPPVPSSETGQENAGGKMAGNLLSGTLMPQIPSNISITNDGAIRVEESRKVICGLCPGGYGPGQGVSEREPSHLPE